MADNVYILVFEGFADWEPSYALAELRRTGGRRVVTVGFTREPALSMGGLRVIPDVAIDEVDAADIGMLILPGGDLWEREDAYPRAAVESLLQQLLAAERPIAAICAGTVALARARLLDDRRHTSNMRGYLGSVVPSYAGEALYESTLAVHDRGIITASGLGPVEFAREVFQLLGIMTADDLELWFGMFKRGVLPGEGTERSPVGTSEKEL